jgi:hypothetical protein
MVRIGSVVLHRGRERAVLDTAMNEMLRASQALGGPDTVGLPRHGRGYRRREDRHMLRKSAIMRCRSGNKALKGGVSKIHCRRTTRTALACFLVGAMVLTLTRVVG